MHIAQRGVVLQRKADRVEHRYFVIALAARLLAAQYLPQLGHGKVLGHMLDLAFDTALRRKFNEDLGVGQDRGIELGLAGAVAPHRIQVHAGLHHRTADDGRIGLVGRDRGDDVGPLHRLGRALAALQLHAGDLRPEVVDELVGGGRVNVKQAQALDAQQAHKGQRLEFALRAIADQRHGSAAAPRQQLGGHYRGGGSAQGGRQSQFAEQNGRAGVGPHQRAKGHDRRNAQLRILGVAVDILEREVAGIGHRHQLHDAVWGVLGQARCLVKILPAREILLQRADQAAQQFDQPHALHQRGSGIGAEKVNLAWVGCHGDGSWFVVIAARCASPKAVPQRLQPVSVQVAIKQSAKNGRK